MLPFLRVNSHPRGNVGSMVPVRLLSLLALRFGRGLGLSGGLQMQCGVNFVILDSMRPRL